MAENDGAGSPERFVDRSLAGAAFERVDLTNATFRDVDLRGAQIRGALMMGASLRGVVLTDVQIYGAFENVTINGIEVGPYVSEQLDLRYPERAAMRPTEPEGFRRAWEMLSDLWDGTLARARTLPEEQLNISVDGEWSFLQTLRHLSFATAAWLHRAVLGDPAPWHPLDLPWDEAPRWEGVPADRAARPPMAEVLALWESRVADLTAYLATVTADDLERTADTPDDEMGFPPTGLTIAACLRVILDEHWEHRLYAERDLEALGADPVTER